MKIRPLIKKICFAIVPYALATQMLSTASYSQPPNQPAVRGGALSQGAPTAKRKERWRHSIARTRVPGTGCFAAKYPDKQWHAIPCAAMVRRPFQPISAEEVGNDGGDVTVNATGTLTSAEGSFPSVTDVTDETDSGDGGANDYSLQLNSNRFVTPGCGCSGWEQFLYVTGEGCSSNWTTNPYNGDPLYGGNSSGCIFMQYWLLNGGSSCPTNWASEPGIGCYTDSQGAEGLPLAPVTDLPQVSLQGEADPNGMDTVTFTYDDQGYATSGDDTVLSLAGGWTSAEFNIFGDGEDSKADFNSGALLVVKTSINAGMSGALSCSDTSDTGETNNLTIVSRSPCCPLGLAAFFTEDTAGTGLPCPAQAVAPIVSIINQLLLSD